MFAMDKLGIQPIALLTQTINFVIIMVILTKFLYKPVTKALAERKKKIEEGLEASEKAKLELEKTEKKKIEILGKARVEAQAIVEAGRGQGKRVEKEIIEKAQEEAKALVEKGKKDVEAQYLEMEKRLKAETVVLGKNIAQKILEDTLTGTSQKAIIDKKIQTIIKKFS